MRIEDHPNYNKAIFDSRTGKMRRQLRAAGFCRDNLNKMNTLFFRIECTRYKEYLLDMISSGFHDAPQQTYIFPSDQSLLFNLIMQAANPDLIPIREFNTYGMLLYNMSFFGLMNQGNLNTLIHYTKETLQAFSEILSTSRLPSTDLESRRRLMQEELQSVFNKIETNTTAPKIIK